MEYPSVHSIQRAAPRHPVLTFCPSTFSAACPGRGRTLFENAEPDQTIYLAPVYEAYLGYQADWCDFAR